MEKRSKVKTVSDTHRVIERVVIGSLAGLIATFPMTFVMERTFRSLPSKEKQPLPPRVLTMKTLREFFGGTPTKENQKLATTLIAHFGFGAMMGALYGLGYSQKKRNIFLSGINFGLFVWFLNYEIIIPAAHLMPAATQQAPRRNLLMIASHGVWGSCMGGVFHLLSSWRNFFGTFRT